MSALALPQHQLRLAVYQPDQPQNTGAMLRLAACFGLGFDIIEPCGFILSDARLRRVAMDYGTLVVPTRHRDWEQFQSASQPRRIILLSTHAVLGYSACNYCHDDILMVGQESAGVPEHVHTAVAVRVVIPLAPSARSLNVGVAAAIVVSEAIRQLREQQYACG